MELTNDFLVNVPVAEAWKVLTDVERIAPLLPGAQLQEVDGDEYRGVVKVKVGPITAQYKGVATFIEKDEAAGKMVLKANGRDTRGQGNANAIITAVMQAEGEGTKVSVVTDLTITGKVAQFGRGVLAEVSAKLLGQFVDSLHEDMASGGVSPTEAAPEADLSGTGAASAGGMADGADAAGSASSQGPRRVDHPDVEPVDLLEVAGGSAAKRIVPVVVVGLLLFFLTRRRRARRGQIVLAEVLS